MIFAFCIFLLDSLFNQQTNILFLKWIILEILEYIALLDFSFDFGRNNIARKPFDCIVACKFILSIFWTLTLSFLIYIFNIYYFLKILSIKYFESTFYIDRIDLLLFLVSKEIESIYIFHYIVLKTLYFILLYIIILFYLMIKILLLFLNFWFSYLNLTFIIWIWCSRLVVINPLFLFLSLNFIENWVWNIFFKNITLLFKIIIFFYQLAWSYILIYLFVTNFCVCKKLFLIIDLV